MNMTNNNNIIESQLFDDPSQSQGEGQSQILDEPAKGTPVQSLNISTQLPPIPEPSQTQLLDVPSQAGPSQSQLLDAPSQIRPAQVQVGAVNKDKIRLKFVFNESATVIDATKTIRMDKILEAFSRKQGIEKKSVKFMFDGSVVNGFETPLGLNMKNNDVIDVMVDQIGGGKGKETKTTKTKETKDKIQHKRKRIVFHREEEDDVVGVVNMDGLFEMEVSRQQLKPEFRSSQYDKDGIITMWMLDPCSC